MEEIESFTIDRYLDAENIKFYYPTHDNGETEQLPLSDIFIIQLNIIYLFNYHHQHLNIIYLFNYNHKHLNDIILLSNENKCCK